jgi:hypothetical protein
MKRLPAVLAEFMHSFMAMKRRIRTDEDCRTRRLYRGSARCNDDRRDAHHRRRYGRLRLALAFRFCHRTLACPLLT